jgi:hypothetical protein
MIHYKSSTGIWLTGAEKDYFRSNLDFSIPAKKSVRLASLHSRALPQHGRLHSGGSITATCFCMGRSSMREMRQSTYRRPHDCPWAVTILNVRGSEANCAVSKMSPSWNVFCPEKQKPLT